MKKLVFAVVAIILLVASLGVIACAPAAPAGPIELRFNTWVGNEQHPLYVNIIKPWADEVEQRTSGKVKVTIYLAYGLAPAGTSLDAVQTGVTDISGTSVSRYPERLHLLGVAGLPMISPTAEKSSRALMDLAEEYPKEYGKTFENIKLLWAFTNDPSHFYWVSSEPVRTADDWKGKLVGVRAAEVSFVEGLGGSPHPFNPATFYEEMEKKVVDGVTANLAFFKALHMEEVTGSMTLVGYRSNAMAHVMSLDVYNDLPRDVQKVIDEVSAPMAEKTAAMFDKTAADVLEFLKAEHPDITLYTLPDAEKAMWSEYAKPTWAEWVAQADALGYPGQEMLDDFIKFVR